MTSHNAGQKPGFNEWDFGSLDVSAMPFPIANALMAILGERTTEGRLNAVFHAYRQITITLAHIALAHYFRDKPRQRTEDEVRRLLSQKMADGNWIRLVKEIITAYADRPGDFILPELVDFYFIAKGRTLSEPARIFEGWVRARNLVVHPETDQERAPADERALQLWKNLKRVLGTMTAVTSIDLLQPVRISTRNNEIQSGVSFLGPHSQFRFIETLHLPIYVTSVEPEESIILVHKRDASRQLMLWPLFRTSADGELLLFHHLIEKQGHVSDAEYISAADGRGGARLSGEANGGEILRELKNLFGRLGKVGIPAFLMGEHRSSLASADPWWALESLAQDWTRDGFGYSLVLELRDETHLLSAIATPSTWVRQGSDDAESLALVVSLHYRLNWPFWASRNRDKEVAARRLLTMLREANRFHRPRLRALCALQSFAPEVVRRLLEENLCSAHDRRLVERYVLTGKMREYLRYLLAHSLGFLRPKAEAVLAELDPPGEGGIDLPLPPEEEMTGESEA